MSCPGLSKLKSEKKSELKTRETSGKRRRRGCGVFLQREAEGCKAVGGGNPPRVGGGNPHTLGPAHQWLGGGPTSHFKWNNQEL